MIQWEILRNSFAVEVFELFFPLLSLKLTASLHLKMDGWNMLEYTSFLLGPGLFSGAMLVSGSVSWVVFLLSSQLKNIYERSSDTNCSRSNPKFWGKIPKKNLNETHVYIGTH